MTLLEKLNEHKTLLTLEQEKKARDRQNALTGALTEKERNLKKAKLEYIRFRYEYLLSDVFYFEERGNKSNYEQVKKCAEDKSEMIVLDIERQDIYTELFGLKK